MMKRLLFSVFAVAMSLGAFAIEENQYVYTSTQRFQATSANMLANGDFASNNFDSWTQDDGTAVDAESWQVGQAEGPDGKNAAQRLGTGSLVQSVTLQNSGAYVVSLWIKGDAIGTTSNIKAFVNIDASLTAGTNSTETPVVTVLSSATYTTDWKQVAAYVNVDDSIFTKGGIPTLVVNLTGMPDGIQVADFSVNAVSEVYDIRIMQNKLAEAKVLMNLPEFNVAEAAEQRATLEGVIAMIEEQIAANALDDFSAGEEMYNAFTNTDPENMGPLEAFLSVTSVRVNSLLTGTETATLTATGKINRGDNANLTSKFPNLELTGGNWQHAANADYLYSAIQGGYANSGTYNAYHVDFPKGKYFFSADIRNASVGSSATYVYTYNLETMCKIFVGKDSTEVGPVFGEDYQHFYKLGTIDEEGGFRVGIEWPGKSSGSAFFVKNVEIRAFLSDINAQVEHIQAWKTYKTQWDAAVNGRMGVLTKIADENYPWGKDSLNRAIAKWDPYYWAQDAKHWITADGEDAGVASTDELTEWAKYQGVEAYSEPAEEGAEPTRLQYQLVRGYQGAINYSIALNKPFTDLATAIDAAKKTRNQGSNQTGDRDTFKAAIEAAIATIKSVRAATTDATMEADAQTLATALETLKAAQEAFLASVTNAPIVDIDFSNPFVEDTSEEPAAPYYIEGKAGRMLFNNVQTDNTIEDTNYALGYNGELNDVLHVGSSSATVVIPEEVGDNDVVRINFDFWQGYLVKCYAQFDLQNAAGESVAKIQRYVSNGTSNTTFGLTADELNKYITTRGSSSVGNVGICVDANKVNVDMVLNYKNNTQQLTLTHATAGEFVGKEVEITAPASGDTKIAKFVLSTNYTSNAPARRCWFDNFKISKYQMSDIEEDITESGWAPEPVVDGIEAVATEKKVANNAIYNLNGQRVQNPTKGLYIINGKKVVIK